MSRLIIMAWCLLLFAAPLRAAPSLVLRWTPHVSPAPVIAWTVYKRVPGPVESWTLVQILPNLPPRYSWSDTQGLPGQEWCYVVRALAADFVESATQSNTACGVMP